MASTRKRGNRYTGLYRDHQSGSQRSAGTFATEKAAMRAAEAAEAIERAGRDAKAVLNPEIVYATQKRGKITVSAYIATWTAGAEVEETSRQVYKVLLKHAEKALGDTPVSEITAPKCRAFIGGLKGRMAATSRVQVLGVFRRMLDTAVDDKLLESNPAASIKIKGARSKEMMIAPPSAWGGIISAAPEHYRLVIETMFKTGMRWSEIVGLKREDIKPRVVNGIRRGSVIKIGRTITEVRGELVTRDYGKSSRSMREIPIPDTLAARLIESAGANGLIFHTVHGKIMRRSSFYRVWKPAVEAAGFPGLRVHDARHSHLSALANDPKVPIGDVRDRAGHADLRTTSRYVHKIEQDDDPCLSALERLAA